MPALKAAPHQAKWGLQLGCELKTPRQGAVAGRETHGVQGGQRLPTPVRGKLEAWGVSACVKVP